MITRLPKIRSRIFPRTMEDCFFFLSTLVLVPAVYIHEMCIVLPKNCAENVVLYHIILVLGVFVFTNIVANFVGLVVTDTSIPREVMPLQKPASRWEYCLECDCYVPPRAWHCQRCRVCILKRDHHCVFSGSCIGHYNHRYFLMFLVYLNIGTLYCIISDTVFLLHRVEISSLICILKIIFPMCSIAMGLETIENEIYILLYLTVISTFVLTSVLLYFHLGIIFKGQVTHDVTTKSLEYDLGYSQNMKEVLGDNWFVTWIFPLVSCKLPHDGINWETAKDWEFRHVDCSKQE